MDLSEYQKKAATTALELSNISPIEYSKLGLLGEAGEVADKIKKLYRDNAGKITQEFKESLVLELGDVCWYIANLASHTNIELGESYYVNVNSIVNQTLDLKKAPIELFCAVMWISKFADTEDTEYCASYSYNLVLFQIHEIASFLGVSLNYVLEKNIEKLMSRKERNVLNGNGDNR